MTKFIFYKKTLCEISKIKDKKNYNKDLKNKNRTNERIRFYLNFPKKQTHRFKTTKSKDKTSTNFYFKLHNIASLLLNSVELEDKKYFCIHLHNHR